MSKGKHTEAQMIAALKQVEAGRKVEDVAREIGVSKHTIYAWKAKYGGMDVTEAQEAKQLRGENTREAANAADPEALIAAYRQQRMSYYDEVVKEHPDDEKYLAALTARALA